MKSQNNIVKKIAFTIASICFWLFVWQFLSQKINSAIFLPTPKEAFLALGRLSKRDDFWKIIFSTFGKIAKGFGLAVVFGTVFAIISYFVKFIEILLSPMMRLIKAVPVASFIILALLWVKSEELSVLISFIMVMPIIYINVLQGFENVDEEMLELAKIYDISIGRRMRFIYLPSVFPGFTSACKIGLGFCFKSGIAAEIIGLPAKSIGSELYKSKLYLMTDELFAWTVVIIVMSVFFEGICIYLLNRFSIITARVNIVKHTQKSVVMGEKNSEKKYLLKVENICKAYGKQVVLSNVNMEAVSGEAICISGKSGLGKTTLLRIISGVSRQDNGQVNLINIKANELKEKMQISVVFQEDRLLENTDIYSNLYFALGKDFDMAKVDKHLEEVGLEKLGKKKVCELSGGMKRRVAIVRSVLREGNVILLDEAFKGLDTHLKENVIKYVKRHCSDRIVIMVTHDLEEGELFGAKMIELSEL